MTLYGNAFSSEAGSCFRWIYETRTTRPMCCTGRPDRSQPSSVPGQAEAVERRHEGVCRRAGGLRPFDRRFAG